MSQSSAIYGGSNDPCILGHNNGTYPNGTLGKGNWKKFGIYKPSSEERTLCQLPNDPWVNLPRYAHWTNYYILAALMVIAVCNAIKRFHALNRVVGIPSVISFSPKMSACARMLSYPQSARFLGALPAAGPGLLLWGFLLFSSIICFGPRPYYRPPNFGSSVLASRTQWVAMAMIPWIYTLGTRRNIVAYLIGVSHQRIMTIHKYSPWICLYMAIVHSCSNIIRANRQEPWWYTWKTGEQYRNGFPSLVALAWLCVMSLGPIRNRSYETFFLFHMIAAITFLVGLYIHTENLLNSFQYLHATMVLWFIGIAWRVLAILINQRLILKEIPRAILQALPGGVFSMRISVPASYTWKPGSHVYIRFLSIRPWETHPFTIASVPGHTLYTFSDPEMSAEKHKSEAVGPPQSTGPDQSTCFAQKRSEMVFLIKPKSGLTQRLYRFSQRGGTSDVKLACILDGPYAGFADAVRACDTLVMIAGGSGMAGLMPLALDVQGKIKVEIHWAIRDRVAAETWFDKGWSKIGQVQIYVTGNLGPEKLHKPQVQLGRNQEVPTADSIQILEAPITNPLLPERGETDKNTHAYSVHDGRPDLESIVKSCVYYQGRVGVVVCGPKHMSLMVRNAVAWAQMQLLSGKAPCKELELYEETYSM